MSRRKFGRTWRERKTVCNFGSKCINVSNDDVYVSLMQWMKGKGFVKTSHLRPAICQDTGRGLMSTLKIDAGQIIVSVPKNLIITAQVVLATSYLAPYIKNTQHKMSPRQCLALFLMCEKGLAENSLWAPYINSLPTSFSMLSDVHDDNSLSIFPKKFKRNIREIRNKMQSEFTQMKQVFLHIQCDIAELGKEEYFSFARFSWAWNCINTRCVYMNQPFCPYLNGEKNHYALVPFLDLLNHSPFAKVKANFNVTTCCYEVTTDVALKRFRQVFINYGNHDNETLLIQYGFVVLGNPITVLQVNIDKILQAVHTKNGDSTKTRYEEKIAAVRKFGLLKDLCFNRGGPSWCLIAVVSFLLEDDIQAKCVEESLRRFLDMNQESTASLKVMAILRDVLSDRLQTIESKMVLLSDNHTWIADAARFIFEDYKQLTLSAMSFLHVENAPTL